MKTESKKLIFAAKDLTNQTVASESGLQIWLSKLGGVLCVVIILEFVLYLALPSSFLRSYELPLQARLVLLCQTWVVLTACGFSIAGLLTLTIWGTNYVAPKQVALQRMIQCPITFVVWLIVLHYSISWATYWQLANFCIVTAWLFFDAQPLQVFHWVDADVAVVVILTAFTVTFLRGRWIPHWVESRPHVARRKLSRIFLGVVSASCVWSLFGTLAIDKHGRRIMQGTQPRGLINK